MKKFLLAVLLLAMSSQVAHASLAAWDANPITVGDKTYYYLSASLNLFNNASVNASEAAGVHSLNLTNLAGSVPGDYLQYAMQINDPTNYFYLNRTSQNDILGNITGGSTTTVYSDPFSTVLNSTPLVGTQVGATYTTSGLQTIYVQTLITGVDGNLNKIQNVTFDVTQSNAIPEPSTYALLTIALGVVGFARRRMNK
jgi:hypothetical protein